MVPVLGRRQATEIALPFPVKMLQRFPVLRRIPARLVGIGVRPEHVRTPNAFAGP